MWKVAAAAVSASLVTALLGWAWWGLPLQRLRNDVDMLFERSAVTAALCAEFGPQAVTDQRGPHATALVSDRP